MSALDEVIAAMEKAVSGIENSEADVTAAGGAADDAVNAASAYGAQDAIAGTAAVKSGIESLLTHLASAKSAAQDVLAQAIAVRDGG